MRVLREWPAGLFLDNRHVGGDKRFQIVACQTSVIKDATAKLQLLEFVLEQPVINLHHDIGIHLDEAAIAVIGKALVIGAPGQPRNRVVIQPEIEHRIHHPRHRGARTRAHRDQKRVFRVSEAGTGLGLDPRHRVGHLPTKRFGIGAVIVVIAGAHLGRDGETRRHRQADPAHLRQVGAFAAKQIAHAGVTISAPGAKTVNPLNRTVVHRSVTPLVWRNPRPVAWPV